MLALNSEKMMPENVSVRLVSAVLEELNYERLYRAYSPKGRRSAADPQVLFEVLVYGYLCGIYSSRKLEEACRYRIDFIKANSRSHTSGGLVAYFKEAIQVSDRGRGRMPAVFAPA